MAITNRGTRNLLSSNQLPEGYEKPEVAKFEDHQYVRTISLVIPKADVEDADPAVTLANIINDATVGINKQVADLIAADYLASATVTTYADLVSLSNNHQSMLSNSAAFTNEAVNYIAVVNLYVKAL